MPRPTAQPHSLRARRRPAGLLSLALLAAGLSLWPQAAVRAQVAGGPTVAGGQPTAAMAEEAARLAAERILRSVQKRDADAYFAQLAPAPRRVSSPAMAAQALARLPRLLSWTIGEIVPGIDSSSVSAKLQTSAGPREVLLVIDGKGRLEGYHINVRDAKAEDVARAFMDALSQGHYVSASSFLSERLREEIPQPALQRRWLNLQLLTGNFQGIKKISRAESNDKMKLVIVTAKFNRLTDNLYVILDNENQIIGVDFPDDPNPPRAAAMP